MSALGIYALAGALFLVAAWAGRLDVDAGGYEDSFFTEHLRGSGQTWRSVRRIAPDKLEHAGIALVLAALATLASARPVAAWAVTVALGVGWELMQAFPRGGFTVGGTRTARGFASWRDVVADAVGAAIGAAISAGILHAAGRL